MRAEYMAAYRASCEIVGCRNILEELELGQQAPTMLYEDNQPCLRTATNNGAEQKRSKSFDLQWFMLKDRIIDNVIRMKYCVTARMVADLGTKLLPRQQFEFLRDIMNGYALVAASRNLGLSGVPLAILRYLKAFWPSTLLLPRSGQAGTRRPLLCPGLCYRAGLRSPTLPSNSNGSARGPSTCE